TWATTAACASRCCGTTAGTCTAPGTPPPRWCAGKRRASTPTTTPAGCRRRWRSGCGRWTAARKRCSGTPPRCAPSRRAGAIRPTCRRCCRTGARKTWRSWPKWLPRGPRRRRAGPERLAAPAGPALLRRGVLGRDVVPALPPAHRFASAARGGVEHGVAGHEQVALERYPLRVHGTWAGAGFEQLQHPVHLVDLGGHVQRGVVLTVDGVDLGAGVEQPLRVGAALGHQRGHQRRG